jgi:hypothetical protein
MIRDYLSLPMILVLAGAILSAVGAYMATYRRNREKAKAAWEQASFQRELREKSDQIAQLNQQIASTVTGGDSFAYCEIEQPDDARDEWSVVLKNYGRYPVYDIRVQIVDKTKLSVYNAEPSQRARLVISSTKNIPVGTLAPGQTAALEPFPVWNREETEEAKGRAYDITITARNGTVSQRVRISFSPNGWPSLATQITHNDQKMEKADPDFPRDKDGQIDWSVGIGRGTL